MGTNRKVTRSSDGVVQIIEFRSNEIDEMRTLDAESFSVRMLV
jgi:hypothetical protein